MTQVQPALFPLLQARVRAAGLYRKATWHEVWYVGLTLSLYVLSLLLIVMLGQYWWAVIFAGIVLGIGYGQAGLLGHDLGHLQVVSSKTWNMRLGNMVSLLMGFSTQSWVHNHNLHHAHPNREESDPDIDFPIVAFSEHQARERNDWRGVFVRHQHWLFPLLIPLLSITMRITGFKFLWAQRWQTAALDRLAFGTHFVIYLVVLFAALAWPMALLFIAVHHIVFGAYLGMIFAPNHKGMEILEHDAKLDYVREQLLTCRNIQPSIVTDLWYGSLNYQIEHHLFPTLPRSSMPAARRIVRQFCQEHQLPYHETSFAQSYGEIFGALREIALYARRLRS